MNPDTGAIKELAELKNEIEDIENDSEATQSDLEHLNELKNYSLDLSNKETDVLLSLPQEKRLEELFWLRNKRTYNKTIPNTNINIRGFNKQAFTDGFNEARKVFDKENK